MRGQVLLPPSSRITLRALGNVPAEERLAHIDLVGAGLPTVELTPQAIADGGLLGAARRGDWSVFTDFARATFERGWALADLGAPSVLWPAMAREGELLWAGMQPGRTSRNDGTVLEGVSPSGARRGDRFIAASVARERGNWPALQALDTALALVGCHLSDALRELTGRALHTRTDPSLACFPGGGASTALITTVAATAAG